MENIEKWCNVQEDCDFPISNGLLGDPDETSADYGLTFPFTLRSLEADMLGGNESNLTNSTCLYPFCVAVLSFTIKNSK